MGGSFYEGSVYTCGPESAGNNCTAEGFQVKFKVYGTGGASNCPPLPTMTSFESWESAAGIIDNWIKCPSMPLINASFDWSAKVRKCPGVSQPSPPPSGEIVHTDGDAFAIWYENPVSVLPSASNDPFDVLGPGPVVDPATVPLLVRDIRSTQSALAGVSVIGEYSMVFRNALGEETSTTHYSLTGKLAPDGRFLIDATVPGLGPDGNMVPLTDILSFDGATFIQTSANSENANVYTSTSNQRDRMIRALAPFAASLVDWLRDPLMLPALPGTAYVVTPNAAGGTTLIERAHVSYGSTIARTIHVIDTSGSTAVVSSVAVHHANGSLIQARTFLDHEMVGDSLKPQQVIDEWYVPGSSLPVLTTALRLARTVILTPAEAAVMEPIAPAGSVWLVRF